MADDLVLKLGVESSSAFKEIERFKAQAIKEFKKIQETVTGGSSSRKGGQRGPIVDALDPSAINRLVTNAKMIGRMSGTLKTFGINLGMVYEDLGQFGDIAKHASLMTQKSLNAPIEAAKKKATATALMDSNQKFQVSLFKPAEYKMFREELAAIDKEFGKSLTTQAKYGEALKRTKQRISASKEQFQGWALSIMFAGQAIKNAMTMIWTSSSKTFQDVMHSVEGTTTGFDILQGSMAYLGFTIGQALEPLAMWLVPIVDLISEWVQKNEDVVRGAVGWGIAFGTLMSAGGGLVLAISGVSEFLDKLKAAPKSIDDIKGADWSGIGEKVKQAAGLIAITYGLTQVASSVEDFKTGKWLDGTLSAVGGSLMTIGGYKWAIGGKGGGALIALGFALTLIEEDKLFQTATNWAGALLGLFTGLGNGIAGVITGPLNRALSYVLNKVAGLIEWATGGIGNDFSKTLRNVAEEMETTTGVGFKQGFIDGFQGFFNEWKETTAFLDGQIKSFKETLQQADWNVKYKSGATADNSLISTMIDNRNYADETRLLSSIGAININIQQQQGEDMNSFVDRIVSAIRAQTN